MITLHDKRFPNETEEYRQARNELLKAERELRQMEKVAQMRRKLPLGGKLKEDYEFTAGEGKKVTLSELFQIGKNTLVIYNMMYAPSWDDPCNMCNSLVDGLNGNARQITQRINLAVVAKAPIEKLTEYAKKIGWKHVQLLSSFETSFDEDYFGEEKGEPDAIINVFVRKEDGIYHTWASELKFLDADPGQDQRPTDIIWPLYNVLDLTPEGREDFYPQLKHETT
jgi:predicted dithiol-disulfide oxidoreductase (DUF899 family)